MTLSDDLKHWRSERPDEWTMDRFIVQAKKLEEALTIIAAYKVSGGIVSSYMAELATKALEEK